MFLVLLVLTSFFLIVKNTFTPSTIKHPVKLRSNIREGKCILFLNNTEHACMLTELSIPYQVARDPTKLSIISARLTEYAQKTNSFLSIISMSIPVEIGGLERTRIMMEIEKRKSLGKRTVLNENSLAPILGSQKLYYNKHILLACISYGSLQIFIDNLEAYIKTIDTNIHINSIDNQGEIACKLAQSLKIPAIKVLDEQPVEGGDYVLGLLPPTSCPVNSVKIGYTHTGVPYCLLWPHDFERHVAILGPTGAGKTTLLSYLTRSFLQKKLATRIYIVDPKGDLHRMMGTHPLITYMKPEDIANLLEEIKQHGIQLHSILIIDEAWRVFAKNAPQVLALLRQARSSGLYIIYATQNPWDLPVSAANNTGTFVIFGSSNYSYLRGIAELTGMHYDEARIVYNLRLGEYIIKTRDTQPVRIHFPQPLTTDLSSNAPLG